MRDLLIVLTSADKSRWERQSRQFDQHELDRGARPIDSHFFSQQPLFGHHVGDVVRNSGSVL